MTLPVEAVIPDTTWLQVTLMTPPLEAARLTFAVAARRPWRQRPRYGQFNVPPLAATVGVPLYICAPVSVSVPPLTAVLPE